MANKGFFYTNIVVLALSVFVLITSVVAYALRDDIRNHRTNNANSHTVLDTKIAHNKAEKPNEKATINKTTLAQTPQVEVTTEELTKNEATIVTNAVGKISIDPQINNRASVSITNSDSSIKITLRQGDTLYSTLLGFGISNRDAYLISKSVNKVYKLSQLKAGEIIQLIHKQQQNGDMRYVELSINNKTIKVTPDSKKKVYHAVISHTPEQYAKVENQSKVTVAQVQKQTGVKGGIKGEKDSASNKGNTSGTISSKLCKKGSGNAIVKRSNATETLVMSKINGSLFSSAKNMKIPDEVVTKLFNLLRNTVDFRRDIRQGSEFKLIYDNRSNDLLYVSFVVRGKPLEVYRHKTKNSITYLNKDGNNIVKKAALLRVPVSGGLIGSGFGMRNHPLYGYSRFHKGIDYRAHRGAPIFAAGDGVVSEIKHHYSYGKYVKLKHSSVYSTLYAHMSGFARDIHQGTTVKQGQVIGYVGSTGLSTGTHLHYELHKNGVQINPARYLVIQEDKALSGQQLVAFKQQKGKMDHIVLAALGGH